MPHVRSLSALRHLVVACVLLSMVGAILVPTAPTYADKGSKTQSIQGSIESGMKDPSMENFGCMTSGSDVPIQGCFAMLAYYFMKLCMWGAAVIAIFLNWVLMELVYGMGQLVGNMPGVMIAWQVLRDVTNVFLVFLTVFIGIAMILNVSSYGSKSLLWKVLLAALLVNFSGTFTKVVIDVSNALALNLNRLILIEAKQDQSCDPKDWLSATSYGEKGQDCINNGIAGAFWSTVKVTSVFNVSNMGTTKVTKDLAQAMMLTGLMGGIMFIVLAFVLGVGAFMLIARFVTLVFLIIVSPMAFVFWLTGTGIAGMGAQWWKSLINNSLTAPLLLLMWWMSLKMFSGLQARFNVENAKASDAALKMSDIGNYGIIVFFLIVMAFLLASIIMAQKLASASANGAVKHMRNITHTSAQFAGRHLGNATLGSTARFLQHSVGGRVGRLASNQRIQEAAAARGGIVGWGARRLAGVGKRAKESSFDIRQAPLIGKKMQQYLGTGTLGSKTTAGGYTAAMKERKERDDATLKWLSEEKLTRAEEKEREAEKHSKRSALTRTAAQRTDLVRLDRKRAAEDAEKIAEQHHLSGAQLEAWKQNQNALKAQNVDPAAKAAELRQRAADAEKRVKDIQRNSRMGALNTEEAAETKKLNEEKTKLETQADLITAREQMLANTKGMREYAEAQAKSEHYKEFVEKQEQRTRLRNELGTGKNAQGHELTEANRQEHEVRIKTLNGEIDQLYGEVDRDVHEIDDLMKDLVGKNTDTAKKQLAMLKVQRDTMLEFFETQQEVADMSQASTPEAKKRKERLEGELSTMREKTVRGSMDMIDARYDTIAKGRATRRKETFFDLIQNETRWSHPIQSPTNFRAYASEFVREHRKKEGQEPQEKMIKSIIAQLKRDEEAKAAGAAAGSSGGQNA